MKAEPSGSGRRTTCTNPSSLPSTLTDTQVTSTTTSESLSHSPVVAQLPQRIFAVPSSPAVTSSAVLTPVSGSTPRVSSPPPVPLIGTSTNTPLANLLASASVCASGPRPVIGSDGMCGARCTAGPSSDAMGTNLFATARADLTHSACHNDFVASDGIPLGSLVVPTQIAVRPTGSPASNLPVATPAATDLPTGSKRRRTGPVTPVPSPISARPPSAAPQPAPSPSTSYVPGCAPSLVFPGASDLSLGSASRRIEASRASLPSTTPGRPPLAAPTAAERASVPPVESPAQFKSDQRNSQRPSRSEPAKPAASGTAPQNPAANLEPATKPSRSRAKPAATKSTPQPPSGSTRKSTRATRGQRRKALSSPRHPFVDGELPSDDDFV